MATGVVTNAEAERRLAPTGSRRYVRVLQIIAVAALLYALFKDVLVDMARDWWNEPELSQGLIVPPLAACIAWLDRRRIMSSAMTTDPRGLLVTLLACAMFGLGRLASEFFLTRLSFVVMLTGLIWTFWGTRRVRALSFPLLLLATMVPLPVLVYDSLTTPLQLFASDLGTRIAQTFGVSAFRDGNIIQLANVSLGVEEACSGLSSLSALAVGSLLLGYLVCTRTLSRITLFAVSVPVAIGANVMRIAGTAMIADNNPKFAMGFYHFFSGWLVFSTGFALLYALASLLRFFEAKHAG